MFELDLIQGGREEERKRVIKEKKHKVEQIESLFFPFFVLEFLSSALHSHENLIE